MGVADRMKLTAVTQSENNSVHLIKGLRTEDVVRCTDHKSSLRQRDCDFVAV